MIGSEDRGLKGWYHVGGRNSDIVDIVGIGGIGIGSGISIDVSCWKEGNRRAQESQST